MSPEKHDNPPITVSREMLMSWLEYSGQNHVAYYGTSIETAQNICQYGYIPPTPLYDKVPYQKQIHDSGKKIYFFLPLIDKLPDSQSALANEFESRIQKRIIKPEDFADDNIRKSIHFYALGHAMIDGFKSETGLTLETADILTLGLSLIPEETSKYLKLTYHYQYENTDDEAKRNASQINMDKVYQQFSRRFIITALRETFSRRGVIMLFSPAIFLSGQAYPGIEAENEFYRVTEKTLPASTILGIEPLSPGESEAIKHFAK